MKKIVNFQKVFLLTLTFFLFAFLSSNQALAADGCTKAYATCKTPDGQEGYCGHDDDGGDLYCKPGKSPINPNTLKPTTGGGGGTATTSCPDGFDCRGGIAFPKETGLSDAPITTILLNILRWLLGIFGTLGVIAFVLSGLQYLTAAGDEERMESGKNNMKYSIIGIIIGLLGLIIVKAVDAALNGTPFF